MKNKALSERLVNYDFLRIVAAYLVVMLHLSVQYINIAPASIDEYLQWQQSIKLAAISRVSVPIFVMLSGSFLLKPDKEITLVTIFKKYLPKLIAIFVFWSFFYSLTKQNFFNNLIDFGISESWNSIDWENFWPYFGQGHYHMWYLYMLAGLYLITPLLKHITSQASKSQLTYFVFLCILITSITKLNQDLWNISFLDMILNKLSLSFFFGYLGYFVGGYLLSTYTPKWPISIIIFILGTFSFRFTYQETWTLNPMFGFETPNLVFFSNYSPTVFFMSFAIFLLVAKLGYINFSRFTCNINSNLKIWKSIKRIISLLPKYMLVVYLVHPFIITQCRAADILLSFDSAWSLPKNAFIVYSLSLIVSIILLQLYKFLFSLICLVFHAFKC